MKAKDLAKILMATPEAEVVIYQYNGGCEPIFAVKTVIHEDIGEKTQSYDGGDFIDENGLVTHEILILTTYIR
jgi:hypothetical protein